jgi:hypothetical protein
MGDEDNAKNQMMQEIQTANDISTHLTTHGHNGNGFKVTVNKVKWQAVMAKRSKECINMIV